MKGKNKTILLAVGLVILLGVMFWLGQPKSNQPSGNGANLSDTVGGGQLTVQESFFDFGTISMARGRVENLYKVKNISGESVVVTKMYTSCMCTIAYLMSGGGETGPFGMPGHGFVPPVNKTIDAGEEITIRAIFDPAAHGPAGVGPVDRAIYLETKSGQVLQVGFKATVTP